MERAKRPFSARKAAQPQFWAQPAPRGQQARPPRPPQRLVRGGGGGRPAARQRQRRGARRHRRRRRRRENHRSHQGEGHHQLVRRQQRGPPAQHRGLQLPACRFFARFLVFFAARDGGAARENRKKGRQDVFRSSQDGCKRNQARRSSGGGEAKRCPRAFFVKILAFAFATGGGTHTETHTLRWPRTCL
jgi:hypothetical protein